MDLPSDFCPREPTLDEMLTRLYSPASFFKAVKKMKSVNFCTVVPDGFGTKIYYISVEEIWQLIVTCLVMILIWRLVEAFQSLVYRNCCKK